VGDGTRKAIEAPDNDYIESAAVCVCEQPIELGTTLLCAGDAYIDVFAGQFPTTPQAILAYLAGLNFGVLAVVGADSAIENGPRVICWGDNLRRLCASGSFLCSHWCTSSASLVRGAFGVQAPTRPAFYFL
jgi:hypothetical protein